MTTHVLEGTVAEVRERLSELPLRPESRVRLTLQEMHGGTEAPQFQNGIMLIPRKEPGRTVTNNLVLELLDGE